MLIKDLLRKYNDSEECNKFESLIYLQNKLCEYYLSLLKDGISYENLYEMIKFEDLIILAKMHEELADEPNENVLKKSTVIDNHLNCRICLDMLREAKLEFDIMIKKKEEKSLKLLNVDDNK